MNQSHGYSIDIGDAMERSCVTTLQGRPYPVQWRNQGAADAWEQALGGTESWRAWSAPSATCWEIKEEIARQLARHMPVDVHGNSIASFQNAQSMMAVELGANLSYHLHRGTVIEATPALESLLAQSDVDLSLPMSMVAAPYQALYLHFGEQAMNHLKTPNTGEPGDRFDGVFCFFTPLLRSSTPGRWLLELIFITKRHDVHNGQISLIGTTDRDAMSVGQWLDEVLDTPDSQPFDDCRTSMHAAMSYVVKLFLYMGLKQARQIKRNDHDDALRRAKGLGERKRAKLLKRTASLYNAIVVGPDSMLPPTPSGATGSNVAPHWRCGHFKMQPFGIGRQERKLIFVAPVLIHADQLREELPTPKTYCATA
jgi:hypothetical protein